MGVMFQNYHKNINQVARAIFFAVSQQKNKLEKDEKHLKDSKYQFLLSFFRMGVDGNKVPNIYVNHYLPISLNEANAIVVGMENVSFSTDVQYIQKAKAIYNIDFWARGDNSSDAINKILFVAGIIREKLLCFGKNFFEGAKNIDIMKLEILPDRTKDEAGTISARLVFVIETVEVLTDIDDFEGADEMMSNISVNNGSYSIEWKRPKRVVV